jgi:hypothetical protein
MSLRELRARRAAVVAEMRSMIDAAAAATRDLSQEERTSSRNAARSRF